MEFARENRWVMEEFEIMLERSSYRNSICVDWCSFLAKPSLTVMSTPKIVTTVAASNTRMILQRIIRKIPKFIRQRGYETFFMLKLVEQNILNAHKYKNIKKFSFLQMQISLECHFSINVKMPTLHTSKMPTLKNFMLS